MTPSPIFLPCIEDQTDPYSLDKQHDPKLFLENSVFYDSGHQGIFDNEKWYQDYYASKVGGDGTVTEDADKPNRALLFFDSKKYNFNSLTVEILGGVQQDRSRQDFVGWFPLPSTNRLVAILMDGHHTATNDRCPPIALSLFRSIQQYADILNQIKTTDEFKQFIISWYKCEMIDKPEPSYFDTMLMLDTWGNPMTDKFAWGVCFDMVLITERQTFLFHHGDTRVYIQLKDNSVSTLPEYSWENQGELERISEKSRKNVILKRYNGLATSRSLGDFMNLTTAINPVAKWIDGEGNDFFPINNLDIQVYDNSQLQNIFITSDGIGTKKLNTTKPTIGINESELEELIKVIDTRHQPTMMKYIWRVHKNSNDDQSFCSIHFKTKSEMN